MRTVRLAILDTHPIQYHVPWYRALAMQPELEIQVLYSHNITPQEHARAGFGVEFDWDIPLLGGYPYRFLMNVARSPTIATFRGLDTPELFEIIEKTRYDAVLINGWHYKSAWQAMWACWRTNTPILMRGDSHLHTPRHPLKNLFKNVVYRRFMPRFDACLPVGTWSRDYMLYYGARPERVVVVPHVVDETWFRAEAQHWSTKRDELRRSWALAESAYVFLFAAKFIPRKRPLDFIHAIANASKRDSRIMGLVVGDGPLHPTCQALVQEQHLPIRFTGFLNQSEIVRAYCAANAFVYPSDGNETWGLAVTEALLCGLPCLVSDRVGSGPDLIAGRDNGAIFPVGDVHTLADKMCEQASWDSQPRFPKLSMLPKEFSLDTAVRQTQRAVKSVMGQA